MKKFNFMARIISGWTNSWYKKGTDNNVTTPPITDGEDKTPGEGDTILQIMKQNN